MSLSINTNNTAVENATRTNVRKSAENEERTNVRKSAEKMEKQTEETREYTAVSEQGDTMEISSSGKAVSENTVDNSDVLNSVDGKVTKIADGTNTTTASQTYNLSSYTENELRQMYQNGEITRTEYDEELSSRE